jgi:hypothetical protein
VFRVAAKTPEQLAVVRKYVRQANKLMEDWDPDIPKSMKTYQSLAAAKSRGVCGWVVCRSTVYLVPGKLVPLLRLFS